VNLEVRLRAAATIVTASVGVIGRLCWVPALCSLYLGQSPAVRDHLLTSSSTPLPCLARLPPPPSFQLAGAAMSLREKLTIQHKRQVATLSIAIIFRLIFPRYMTTQRTC